MLSYNLRFRLTSYYVILKSTCHFNSFLCTWLNAMNVLKDICFTRENLILFIFLLVLVCSQFKTAFGVVANHGRDSLIERYFTLGLIYVEIISFLLLTHGISISLSQLKRVLRKKSLTRRRNYSDPAEVVSVVEMELQGSGTLLGYRLMHQRLRNDYGLVLDRETVRKVLKTYDPDGDERRSNHKLKRRKYQSKGANYIWHFGCIDGCNRRIMWLDLASTNNNPRVVGNIPLTVSSKWEVFLAFAVARQDLKKGI